MFAAVYIPDFFLQAVLRLEPELAECPAALVKDDSPRSPIWQVTAAAHEFGVAPGMTSTQAKARCDTVAFRLRSPVQEETAQEILLECAYLSAAYIESTAPGICTIDLRGLPILQADPLENALARWAAQLIQRLAGLNLRVQVGLAATPALALQAAQSTKTYLHITDATQFWKNLPLENLSPPPDLLEVLTKWGIRSVGEFLALGKARIAERLGSAGMTLYEQARANSVRPLNLTAPRQSYRESFQFEQLVETLEPLLFIVRRLLDQLARRMELLSRSISEIDIQLRLESGNTHGTNLRIPSPTRDPEVLFRIAFNYLETVRTPSPILGVSIEARPCETEIQQFQLFETSVRDPNKFYETIGRLGALLGSDRVGIPVVQNSHRPDDFVMEPPTANRPASLPAGEPLQPARGLVLRRFRPPLPATVRLKKGAPIFFETTGLSGTIALSQGPWRSSGNWWENLWAREEWDVQMKDGTLYRIFLEKGAWFVDGAYD